MSYSITPGRVTSEQQSEVERRPRALLHFWLHPRVVFSGLAEDSRWSWIPPIGLALLVFYARIFTLAYLRDPSVYWTLAGGAATILLGWQASAALLYALTRLTGGRAGFTTLLVLCAWATLPFTLRSATQVVYMLAAGRLMTQPGLAGLLSGADGSDWAVRAGQLVLGRLDFFTIWHLGLLALAVNLCAQLAMPKAIVIVVLYAVLTLLFAASVVIG